MKLDPGDRIEHVHESYTVGDVNNDKVIDTAIAVFDRIIKADSSIWNDCGKGICELKIEFRKPVAPIIFEAMNVYIEPTLDVNSDGANEILVYKWRYECCWVTLDLYTYKGNTWKILSTTKAFITWDENDFKNRVIRKNNNYYLIGQKWNKDYSIIIEDKIRIKTK